MEAAITQFLVVQVCRFSAFVCEFLYACYLLALFFGLLDALQKGLGHLCVFVQVIVELSGDKVVYKSSDCWAVWGHIQ